MLHPIAAEARRQVDYSVPLLVAVATLGLFASLALLPWADTFGLLALAVSALIVAWVARSCSPGARRMIMLGLALRIGAALIQYYVTPLPDSEGDATFFEFFGWLLSEGGVPALVEGAAGGFRAGQSPSYSWFIGIIYLVSGVRSPLAIQASNVLFGSLAIVVAYRTALLLWDERAATRVATVAALFPALILYSAITLREAPVVFLLSLVALRAAQWSKTGKWRCLYAAVLYGLTAAFFHLGAMAAVFAVGALGVVAVVRNLGVAGRRKSRALLLLAAVAASVFILFQLNIGIAKLGETPLDAESLGVKQAQRTFRGEAAYLTGLQLTNWFDVVWQGPIRVFYLLFTPFPWQVRTTFQAVGFVDVAFYWWLAITVLRHRREIWANRPAHAVVVILGGLLLAYGLGTSNFGTALRHRQKAVLLLLVLAGAAWVRVRRQSPGLPRPTPVRPEVRSRSAVAK